MREFIVGKLLIGILLFAALPSTDTAWGQTREGRRRPPEPNNIPAAEENLPGTEAETETGLEGGGLATNAALQEYARIAESFAFEDEEEKEIRFHHCKHVQGETIARVLQNFLTPSGTVATSEEADIVIISETVENIKFLIEIAENLDQPVNQVLVEARIIEFGVDTDFQKEINLEFQKLDNVADIPNLPANYMDFVKRLTDAFVDPGSNPLNTRGSFSYMRWDPDRESLLTVFVRFLETSGKARILSAPNLILRRGAEGSIITGEEVPIQTQTITSGSVSTSTTFKSVGIKLRVTPVTIENGRIRLIVSPEVSNVTRYDESTGAPIIAVRNAQTELEMLDGQLVSIGGLLRSEEIERERRVPLLASIPLLGHLFRGTSKRTVQTQLVIFLRARVLDHNMDELPAVRTLELPADVQKEIEAAEGKINPPPTSFGRDLHRFFNDGKGGE